MDCQQTEEAILDSFEETLTPAVQRDVERHLTGCRSCSAFAATQQALDRALTRTIAAPEMGAAFRPQLRDMLTAQRPPHWWDALPDVVHLGSCAVATLVAAAVMPFNPMVVAAVGVGMTCASYMVLATVRDSLELL